MSGITTTGIADLGTNLLSSYYENIQDTVSLQNISLTELDSKNKELKRRQTMN